MACSGRVAVRQLRSVRYTGPQMRILAASLDLFAEHGVSATSLQMIADAVGVTKAAVYHQFRTKEAIVIGALEVQLGGLEEALEAAESGEPAPAALDRLLTEVIDLAVERRRIVSTLLHDPVIVRVLEFHEPFQQFMERLFRVLLGGRTDAVARVRVAMAASAIGGAVTHPLVAGIDEDTLRGELFGLTRRFLDLAE